MLKKTRLKPLCSDTTRSGLKNHWEEKPFKIDPCDEEPFLRYIIIIPLNFARVLHFKNYQYGTEKTVPPEIASFVLQTRSQNLSETNIAGQTFFCFLARSVKIAKIAPKYSQTIVFQMPSNNSNQKNFRQNRESFMFQHYQIGPEDPLQ